MIQLKNAALESSAGKKSVHALRCLNVTLPETGLVVLTGASGSGKTALLHLLALRETPSRGEILIGGENTARWSETRRSAWLRECAAADEALLFADLTLSENAERAAVLAGFSDRDARENAREALALLGSRARRAYTRTASPESSGVSGRSPAHLPAKAACCFWTSRRTVSARRARRLCSRFSAKRRQISSSSSRRGMPSRSARTHAS